jgi:pyruvate dehydrogenase E1 component beta subunit
MRPIVDLQFSNLLYCAMDQLVNQAAKARYLFGGQATMPIVFRCAHYYGKAAAAHHSDRPHAMFMNVPGLKIVAPSTPADVKGLLKTAIREDDPVLCFEDATLHEMTGPVPDGDVTIPLGVADVKRAGDAVSVVAIGGTVPHAMVAAEQLAGDGVAAEVIDPRSLVPLDVATILASVRKTGRLVIADTAPRTCSAASEIAAIVAEEGFADLRAPIRRVTSAAVHTPFSPALEAELYPTAAKIIAAIRSVLLTSSVR